MDKIRALRYFKRVAELRSFTSAAEEFDVPASSVSRRVRNLETFLGVELLQRSTRQVTVTELGQLYYSMVSEGLRQLEGADELISQSYENPGGIIRISCMPSYGELLLTPQLDNFLNLYPDIIFDLHYSDELTSPGKDPVDIAIRGGYAPDEHVIARRISNNEFILVASPEFVDKLGDQLPLSEMDIITGETLQYRGPKGLISWFYLNEDGWKELELTPRLISNNGKALANAALNHRGMACAPEWSVRQYLTTGELVKVPAAGRVSVNPGGDIGIFLLYQRSRYQIPKIKLCIDFLYQQLTKEENDI